MGSILIYRLDEAQWSYSSSQWAFKSRYAGPALILFPTLQPCLQTSHDREDTASRATQPSAGQSWPVTSVLWWTLLSSLSSSCLFTQSLTSFLLYHKRLFLFKWYKGKLVGWSNVQSNQVNVYQTHMLYNQRCWPWFVFLVPSSKTSKRNFSRRKHVLWLRWMKL